MGRANRRNGQESFGFPCSWGGRRKGAGAKSRGERAGVPHDRRAPLASRFPVHVSMKLRIGLPSLRCGPAHSVLIGAFVAMRGRERFRLVHYSIQSNHLHFVCEALDRRELTLGVQSLAIRIAKGLNALWKRSGKLF